MFNFNKNVLGRQLVRSVFSWYFIFAVIITSVHLAQEYFHSKAKVERKLTIISKTFTPALAQSLYDDNFVQTNSAFFGMIDFPVIVGLTLNDTAGVRIAEIGDIDGSDLPNWLPLSVSEAIGVAPFRFDIHHPVADGTLKVGSATIYSSTQVILNILKGHLFFILIDAAFKTLALLILVLLISERMLSRPLRRFVEDLKTLEQYPQSQKNVDIGLQQTNELSILENAFNNQHKKQQEYQRQLTDYAENLESLVEKRTHAYHVAKEKAEQANESKSAFLAKTSHEVRTPLNAIANLSALLDDAGLKGLHRQQLSIIQQSSNHLLTVINDILDLSKIEAGEMDIMPRHMVTSDFLQSCIDPLMVFAQSKGLSLQIQLDDSVFTVAYVDADRLRQVIINLVNNAIKFTEMGSVTLSVKQEGRSQWVIQVIDTGIGIKAEDQTHLFQYFSQVYNPLSQQEGSGLGLMIAKQIIELMGGKISLESDYGKGTTFTLTLPVEAGDVDKIQHKASNNCVLTLDALTEQQARALDKPLKSIIMAEDNATNFAVAKMYFDQINQPLSHAENGQILLNQLKDHRFDIVLLDIDMPVLDGFTTCAAIRDGEGGLHHRDVIIVMVSAYATVQHQRKSLDAGANGFMTKPIDFNQLFETLKLSQNPINTAAHDAVKDKFGDIFLNEYQGALTQLPLLISNQQYKSAERLCHQLKSTAAVCGYQAIADQLNDLELDLQMASPTDAQEDLLESLSALNKLSAA
ncbi:MAG: ATP-binding protein [Cellvibrionales bacterium]|nr:ATP-binding protein [Cellvibrionales bacterium]